MAPQTQPRQPSSAYLAQAGLTVALGAALRRLWPQVNPTDLASTLPDFKHQVEILVDRFSLASTALAARNYQRARRDAGILSSFAFPKATAPASEQVQANLGWATDALWSVTDKTATEDVAKLVEAAQAKVEGASTRLVLEVSRKATVTAVEQDTRARAWARETRPNCCYFCAMLATRGAAYKSADTAGREANAKFTGEGEFKFHDHCRCIAVPVFGVYEKTAEARAWTRQWHDWRRENGRSPSLLEWRQAFDGRAPAPTNVPQ